MEPNKVQEMMKQQIEQDVIYIKDYLIPEMVHDRCFCEPGSREFVELQTVEVEPILEAANSENFYGYAVLPGQCLYRALVVVLFSGEQRLFHVLVKLLAEHVTETDISYGCLLNEEILWNKGRLQYGEEVFPRYYLADLGRYGRPVVVVEDPKANGYERIPSGRMFSLEEGKLVAELLGRLHGTGLLMRQTKFPVFRELYVKLEKIATSQDYKSLLSMKCQKLEDCTSEVEKSYSLCEKELTNNESILSKWPNSTLCQGCVIPENIWFRRDERTKQPVKMQILNWQWVQLGPLGIDLIPLLINCNEEDRDEVCAVWAQTVHHYCPTVKLNNIMLDDEENKIAVAYRALVYCSIY